MPILDDDISRAQPVINDEPIDYLIDLENTLSMQVEQQTPQNTCCCEIAKIMLFCCLWYTILNLIGFVMIWLFDPFHVISDYIWYSIVLFIGTAVYFVYAMYDLKTRLETV